MRKLLLIQLIIFCFSAIGVQAQLTNRISLQTGLFHCFFDKSPLLNTNYLSKYDQPFGGLLISSFGVNYSRKINEKSFVAAEVMLFSESYRKYFVEEQLINVTAERNYVTTGFDYGRLVPIANKINLVYGAGLKIRMGNESSIVARTSTELNLVSTSCRDVGLNGFAGIDFSPWKYLTLYSRVNFLGFVYQREKTSQWDASLRLGLGFNF